MWIKLFKFAIVLVLSPKANNILTELCDLKLNAKEVIVFFIVPLADEKTNIGHCYR